MFRELIQLDPAFYWALRISMGILVLQFGVSTFSPGSAPLISGLMLGLTFATLGIMQLQRRCGVMEANLPIPARTLWLSRLVSMLSLIWIPSAIMLIGLAYTHDTDRLFDWDILVAGPLAVTLCLTILQRFDRGQVELKRTWLIWVSLSISVAVVAGGMALLPAVTVAWAVLTLCAVMLLITMLDLPLTFQSAPREPVDHHEYSKNTASGESWITRNGPYLRFVKGPQLVGLLIALMSPVYISMGNSAMVALLSGVFVSHALIALMWMLSLPIKRDRILALIVLPYWSLFTLGYLALPFMGTPSTLRPLIHGPGYWVVDHMMTSGMMAFMFSMMLWQYRKPAAWRTQWSKNVAGGLIVAPMLLIAVASLAPLSKLVLGSESQYSAMVVVTAYLADVLPSSMMLLLPMSVCWAAMLWWILSRVFSKMETQRIMPGPMGQYVIR